MGALLTDPTRVARSVAATVESEVARTRKAYDRAERACRNARLNGAHTAADLGKLETRKLAALAAWQLALTAERYLADE